MLRLNPFTRLRCANRQSKQLRWDSSSLSSSSSSSENRRVIFGDVTIPLRAATRTDLVPSGFLSKFDLRAPEIMGHFRWIAQKHSIGQDMFLLSSPSSLTRHMVLAMAELCEWEVEHLVISRDTAESDLKQRREIVGGSVVFEDQAPVRAALNGRLLILDGIEKAERNVLPTLNNLLENREMALEDGRFLTRSDIVAQNPDFSSRLLAVHPAFRVVALGSPSPPYPGRSLDPPLRSRFQSRYAEDLAVETILSCVDMTGIAQQDRQNILSFYESLRTLRASAAAEGSAVNAIPSFSIPRLQHCISLLSGSNVAPSVSVEESLCRSFPLGCFLGTAIKKVNESKVDTSNGSTMSNLSHKIFPNVAKSFSSLFSTGLQKKPSTTKTSELEKIINASDLTSSQRQLALNLIVDLKLGRGVCLLGSKGSGKSHIVSRVVNWYDAVGPPSFFPLYQEMTVRDMLQTRITTQENVSSSTRSAWKDSPLVVAARTGAICILDGIDRVDTNCLLSLSRLLSDGFLDLPNGERLVSHPSFRVIALSLAPASTEDARNRFLSTDLNMSFHTLPDMSPWDIRSIVASRFGELTKPSDEMMFMALESVHKAAHEHSANELYPSLRTALRCFHILRSLQPDSTVDADDCIGGADVRQILESTLLVKFLSPHAIAKFNLAMRTAGLSIVNNQQSTKNTVNSQIVIKDNSVTIGGVTAIRRMQKNVALIPNPVFYENKAQSSILLELLRAFRSGGNSPVLLIGNQGVGKNKIVDYLLYLLQAEREYVQLHRDTSIQTLTLLPRVEMGKISYEDSPMVRAAINGRSLVLDEVDKAPLEVVCLLKALVGDGNIPLSDGRRLVSKNTLEHEYAAHKLRTKEASLGMSEFCTLNSISVIHDDFRLFVLANRPGLPFLGNNFFRECGDLFTTVIVSNPDVESEFHLLKKSAPNANEKDLQKLASIFSDLRASHDEGQLSYPFSAREAVGIARHLQAFPQFGMSEAVENVLAFDTLNASTRDFVAETFRKYGFTIPESSLLSSQRVKPIVGADGRPMEIKREGAWSKPRTGTDLPKHGKEDPKNAPHVGGNTWAGGTGGSDTAGLGGRGGPYRLDKGHAVHQVSDEDKAHVSEESRRKAAKMAQEALQKRLQEISMGQTDYDLFKRYSVSVEMPVRVLKDALLELLQRKKERVWLRMQSHGELDEDKIVDGLAGERLIFKRRYAGGKRNDGTSNNDGERCKKRIQFVMDVSGSMMRFNSMDGRLERMLSASLMIMEALPRKRSNTAGEQDLSEESADTNVSVSDAAELVEYSISGHSGDTASEIFVDFTDSLVSDDLVPEVKGVERYFSYETNNKRRKTGKKGVLTEKDKMQVLETMIAHSQFCFSGDNTLAAIETAVSRLTGGDELEERLVIVVSDANFRRYGIRPMDLREAMQKNAAVKVHLVLIASLRDEAEEMTAKLPVGCCHICYDNSLLPTVIRKILTDENDSSDRL